MRYRLQFAVGGSEEITIAGLKASGSLVAQWNLSVREAAAFLGTSESGLDDEQNFDPETTPQQKISHRHLVPFIIYKALGTYFEDPIACAWMTRANTGPLFAGARPVDVGIEGGLPALLEIRCECEGVAMGL
ncbi:hypothetical protein BMI87_21420 [Thioclava sp. F28-4]|nr:hypothetical protein BMI87_21420 [Thioclava sp. F28-4]